MSTPPFHSTPVHDLLPQTEGFDALAELALDMRWSWNHATDTIWRELEPELWEITHNPWVVVQTASRDQIEHVWHDPVLRKTIEDLLHLSRRALETPAWFQEAHAAETLSGVAYFSMEFMLSEALPIYSGGLGNVAGDQLKAASDLGVPVIGIGLLYQQGYFRQAFDDGGIQHALFPYNDPGQLPIIPLRNAGGEWVRFEIALPGYSVWLRAWQAKVGRAKLLLLDSNDIANVPTRRAITSELYGGGPELRLQQELLLGIGGWRLLTALGLEPEVCHLNEGHAAFAVLERAQSYMRRTGLPFEAALAVTRAGTLFTTHTAVAAGFDRFEPGLIERYLGRYAQEKLGIGIQALLALGRANPDDATERFNMAYLAVRGSGAVNAVSHLHGTVSRHIFGPLFAQHPEDEVPVGHVTNGVHTPTWDSAAADALWTEACGKERWLGPTENLASAIQRISDGRVWQFRNESRKMLVTYTRERLARQLAAAGTALDAAVSVRDLFDPNALTLGFARRFATYKRPNLLLHDPPRLLRILTNPVRPVQLLLAGKAHPEDRAGQALIQEWIRFIRQPAARPHIVFLSDYDMLLTEQLVQGVDVWLNTPRRPWEACGTSGMKILVNGGLNLSELDGWWAEAYAPELGWALGDGQEHAEDPASDAAEADALYGLLEREVIPEFFARVEAGIPRAWVQRIRASMSQLTPRFSANRAVREYTEQHYLPAAAAYRERAAEQGAKGRQIVAWQGDLKRNWGKLRFGTMSAEAHDTLRRFEVQVFLAELDPSALRVELYANGVAGGPPERQEMTLDRPVSGAPGGYVYRATAPGARPVSDYTARLIPAHPGVAVPLEEPRILWQR
jgi:starch phosphorylase